MPWRPPRTSSTSWQAPRAAPVRARRLRQRQAEDTHSGRGIDPQAAVASATRWTRSRSCSTVTRRTDRPVIDDRRVLLMLEEGDELGELGSPAEGTEDVAPPTEHDPSNLRTRGAVQALEHGSAERIDPLAGLVRNRSVDRLDRRVRPRDRAHADRRDRSVVRPGRRMEEREEPRPRVVLGSDRPFAISNERNGTVRNDVVRRHGVFTHAVSTGSSSGDSVLVAGSSSERLEGTPRAR